MLFMHKDAERWPGFAVYSGKRPKGNEMDYVFVRPEDKAAVMNYVRPLALELGVPGEALPGLEHVLENWLQSTEFDRQQKQNIYNMMAHEGMEARRAQGIPANWRYYNNYTDLVLALYGELCSQDNLLVEDNVAAYLLASQKITGLLRDVAGKITVHAEHIFPEPRDALVQKAYKDLHPHIRTWEDWKAGFPTMTPRELVPVLYDITMSFKAPLNWTEPSMDHGKITKDNMRMNVSTPEEDFYWTSRARWAAVPIWAAPSYTAQLMLLVAKNAGAETDEILAFAYGIFAYWNQVYPHTATPIHRMYGVMTAAQEFGVPALSCDPKRMYIFAIHFGALHQAKL